jgi:ABC-2 type transport system ATP-binding protein
LINDPKLVILDEPMSGLDPVGRKDVRDIILRLKEEGKTVFFSTHVLSDAEMICDQVGIIIKGQLRNVGRLEEMLNPKVKSVEVCVKGLPKGRVQALDPMSKSITTKGEESLISLQDEDALPQLIQWTEREGGKIVSIVPRRETLEDIFIEEMRGERP